MTEEQYNAALRVAFDAGWYAAIHEAADTAAQSGWGSTRATELAERIAKRIRDLAGDHSHHMPPEWKR